MNIITAAKLRKYLPFISWAWLSSFLLLACSADDRGVSTAQHSNTWEVLPTNGVPSARHEASLVAYKDKLYLIGGRGNKPVDVFDPKTQTWQAKSTPPIELHHFQASVLGDAIYIVGAMTGGWPNEALVDRVLVYYPEQDKFAYTHDIPKHRRRGGAGVAVYKGKLYVLGGTNRGHMGGYRNWFDEYDPRTGQWRELPDAPDARDHFSAAVIGDKLYAFAGRTTSQATNEGLPLLVQHGNVFDFETQKWLPVTENLALPTLRAGALVTTWQDEVIIGGGESHTQRESHSEVEAYNVVTQSWRSLPSLSQGRHGSGFGVIDGYLYTASGSANAGGGPELDSIERYKLAEDSQQTKPTEHTKPALEVHQQWHTLTLSFAGPHTSETAEDNPFTNYRLYVEFSNGDKQYLIRGYFAADGNAAESSAQAGNIWQVRFTPDTQGIWRYKASLRKGPNIAIEDDPNIGSEVDIDRYQGEFKVVASNKSSRDFRSKGRLGVDNGYFRFVEQGEYWLKRGANSPENFLAYVGIDGTYRSAELQRKGEAKADLQLHRYPAHVSDWQYGDPSWQNGKGKGIIGVVNYLAAMDMNALYFITMNIQGDGQDVWPYIDPNTYDRFDVSRLDQWEIIFQHMQQQGILLHLLTQETENERLLDDGDTGLQRKLYYRELIARFSHHLGLVWNLGEENGPAHWSPKAQNDAQRVEMSNYLHDHDPYGHPIVIHTHSTSEDKLRIQTPMLGLASLDGLSFQVDQPKSVASEIEQWRRLSKNAGKGWLITMDEIGPWQQGALSDDEDPDHNALRHHVLWGSLMAGAAGIEWYFGAHGIHGNDITTENLKTRHRLWQQTAIAAKFFERYRYWNMAPMPELTPRKDDYCLALAGSQYLLYLPDSSAANRLTVPDDTHTDTGTDTDADTPANKKYRVLWYNPRKGGELIEGKVIRVSDTEIDIGLPPHDLDQDWAAEVSIIGV